MQREMPPIMFLLLSTFSLFALGAGAAYLSIPPSIQCTSTGCTVDNYQGIWGDRKPCKASKAIYPTSEADLFEAVALASKTGSKIKVVSKGSHSIPKLVCPGGDHGLLISTQFYNSFIHVNLSSLTVTAHAGVMLRPLLDHIAAHGLTLPQTPYWQGVSVAGMISTGAHGSGMWGKGSAPHDYVVGIRLIVPASEEEGYAKVVNLVEGDEDLNAARLSLGVLGAISMVTFQLEPMFKRSVKAELRGDERLEDEVLEFTTNYEFGKAKWYPGSGKAIYRVDDRVGVETEGDGEFKMGIVDNMKVDYVESLRSTLEELEKSRNIDGLCQEEAKLINFQYSSGDGLVNDGTTFTRYPVVGFNHKMQSAGGCEEKEANPIITPTRIDFNPTHEHHTHGDATMEQGIPLSSDDKLVTCFWNPLVKGFLLFDAAISIPAYNFRDAIIEIKKLRDMNPKAMCALSYVGGGIQMRFLTASKAYLGESTSSIVFEMVYYRAKTPFTPWLHQDIFEEIEQMLIDKFGGKPHWGKNRELAFEDMHTRTPAMGRFLEVRQRFDPAGLFSSEWTNAILGIKPSSRGVQTFQDYCAIEGLCVCKEDSHCHPTNGYFCRPGYVYKDARVCRHEKQDSIV